MNTTHVASKAMIHNNPASCGSGSLVKSFVHFVRVNTRQQSQIYSIPPKAFSFISSYQRKKLQNILYLKIASKLISQKAYLFFFLGTLKTLTARVMVEMYKGK
jgi:hypothetical protein